MSKPRGSSTLKTKHPGSVTSVQKDLLEVEHRKLSDLRLDDNNTEELNMFFRGLTYVTNYLF